MKTLLLISGAVLVMAPSLPASAAPGGGCSQITQDLKTLATTIEGQAGPYWAHRENFVALRYGSRTALPNAEQLAENEKTSAAQGQAVLTQRLVQFRNLVAEARGQDCLPADQLAAIAEPAIKRAKTIIYDRFPPDELVEGVSGPKPTRMPP